MRLSFLCLRPVLAIFLLTLGWPGNFAIAQVQPEETPKGNRGPRRVFADYDLRLAERVEPAAKSAARAAYRGRYLSPERIADVAALTRGIEAVRTALSARIPTLQVESNLTGRFTEIVGVTGARQFLTAPSSEAPEAIVRGFLTEQAALYGLSPAEVKALVKFTDYTNPAGNLSWVEFRQEIHGLPVFQAEIRAALTPRGALVRTTGNLVPALDPSLLSAKPRLSAEAAVGKAAATIDVFASPAMLRVRSTERNGRVMVMGGGPFDGDTRAELVWFPVEPGVAVLAWSLTLWQPIYSYIVMVDANDGTLLWRKCITQHQTQTATYSVYTSDSPAPLSPTNVLPGAGTQAPGVARTAVTLIADDLTASPLGWITDGNNSTLGNNVTAGVDLSAPTGWIPMSPAPAGSSILPTIRRRWAPMRPILRSTATGSSRICSFGRIAITIDSGS